MSPPDPDPALSRELGPGAALATDDGDTVTPGELSRGPWDPDACHGGPVGALLARAAERADGGGTEWQVARLTIELVRPVPLAALRVEVAVPRPGRKVSLVEVGLSRAHDGVEVARARVLRIRAAAVELPDDPLVRLPPPFGAPEDGSVLPSHWRSELPAFHQDAVEMRFVEGSFADAGPAAVWIRLRCPVVAGEEPSGLQRAVAAADFGNGVSRVLDSADYRFINPDLTVHLARPPGGEWIGLRSATLFGGQGAGVADTELFDAAGRIGRSVQSLLLEQA